MPYITQKSRKLIDPLLKDVEKYIKSFGVGDLNYIFTKIIHKWIKMQGKSYKNYNAAIGVLECAKMELYRMIAASYEDKKKEENGYISELDRITKDEKQRIWKCNNCGTVFTDSEIYNLTGYCTIIANRQLIRPYRA